VSTVRIVVATIQKDFRIALSYRLGFMSGIIAGFWGLVAFRFVSKLVNSGQFSGDSTSYFRFTVVGLLLVSILVPTATGASMSARNEQVQGTLEYLASQPVPRLALGLSWSAYGFIESSVIAIIVAVLTVMIGFNVAHIDIPVVIATIFLSIVIFSAIGNLGAALVIMLQQGMSLVAGLLSVVVIISGTLFPISEFPSWIQAISHLSPLTYALEALRSALLTNQAPTSIAKDLAILTGFALMLMPLSSFGLSRAFRVAQRKGSLGTY